MIAGGTPGAPPKFGLEGDHYTTRAECRTNAYCNTPLVRVKLSPKSQCKGALPQRTFRSGRFLMSRKITRTNLYPPRVTPLQLRRAAPPLRCSIAFGDLRSSLRLAALLRPHSETITFGFAFVATSFSPLLSSHSTWK